MRVARCTSVERIEVADQPQPALGPGDLLISVKSCGVCGTDIKKLQGAGLDPPVVLGHEIAGKVEGVGKEISAFKKGERVVVAHHVPCFECHYCRHGNFSMCRDFKKSNLDPGGFAEFLRIPALHVQHTTFKIPDHLSDDHALMTEPLACAVRCMKRVSLTAGDVVVLVGFGSIGYLLLALLNRLEVKTVVVDLDAARLAKAQKMGAVILNDSAQIQRTVLAMTGERGADLALFTAGPETLLAQSLAWVRDGATLCLFSELTGAKGAVLDPVALYKREITIVSSYSPGPQDLSEAFHLIAENKIDLSGLEFTHFGLHEISKAIAMTLERKVFKAVIDPHG